MMQSEIEILPALPIDIPAIQEIVQETWPATYLKIIGQQQLDYMLQLFYSTEALLHQMKQGHLFLIAKQDNRILAFAAYNQEAEKIWKLQKLYALPITQGKGIGSLLIDYIINDLKSRKAACLKLNVNRYNSAKIFYEKLGFEVLAAEDIDIGNGYFMNDYVMQKNVE